MIGMILAAILAFNIGKRYGKPLLIKWFGKKTIDKVNNFPHKHILLFLFVIFVLPIFPDDIIIFLAGMTAFDTRMATSAVSNYEDLDLKGKEMEVLEPSISDILIRNSN